MALSATARESDEPLMPASRSTLRDFQTHLAERLASATIENLASKLGMVSGGVRWLVDLTDVSEVVVDATVTPVPWTQPWFGGVANVRGTLYGCTDLAAFMGLPSEGTWGRVGLLLVHPKLGVNAALRIEQALGLHNPAQLQTNAQPQQLPPPAAEFVRAHWVDAGGASWVELDLAALVASPRFLNPLAAAT